MFEEFRKLCHVAESIGTVTQAMMYESGFITIEGKTNDGKNYSITMSFKEEEKDGESV